MEAMKCSKNLLCIPIGELFIIVDFKKIDMYFISSDQYYTICLLNQVFLSSFKIGSLLS